MCGIAGLYAAREPKLAGEAALIAEAGTFEDTKALPVCALSYWVVNGGKDGGTITTLDKPDEVEAAGLAYYGIGRGRSVRAATRSVA